MSKSGIVNVRMVITEEKILSNIDKVQKLINPNSKKQIVQLEEDTQTVVIGPFAIDYYEKHVHVAKRNLVQFAGITNMDELSRKYHLELSTKDGLFYEQISDNEVVVIDLRNKHGALYVHSDVKARLDENGVLTVVISDRTAYSETEIR